MLLTKGQTSDYNGAARMLEALPKANVMLGDRRVEADWFRTPLGRQGHRPLHPVKSQPQDPDPA